MVKSVPCSAILAQATAVSLYLIHSAEDKCQESVGDTVGADNVAFVFSGSQAEEEAAAEAEPIRKGGC